jgi:hypothetical protein
MWPTRTLRSKTGIKLAEAGTLLSKASPFVVHQSQHCNNRNIGDFMISSLTLGQSLIRQDKMHKQDQLAKTCTR